MLPFTLFTNPVLQDTAFVELAADQFVTLRAIPQEGFQCFALVAFLGFGVLASQALPDAGEAARHPCGPCVGLGDPALFLRFCVRLPLMPVPSGHPAALEFQCLAALSGFQFRLPDEPLDPVGHARRNISTRIIDRGHGRGIAEARRHILCFHACLPRYGIDFTAIINGDNAAPITARQHEAVFLESLRESCAGIRAVPAFLEHRL